MTAVAAFAAPAPTRPRGSSQLSPQKRKRSHLQLGTESGAYEKFDQYRSNNPPISAEYSTVITPAERSQKRLAGLSVDRPVPAFPFPHAPQVSGSRKTIGEGKSSHLHNAQLSLHTQHLATLSAILHRSMMTHDYVRARRALGMILRNELGGRPIDIRADGLWAIGAEILLRSPDSHVASSLSVARPSTQITREGFERSKSYYENLMVQYPVHKTWPRVINAIDFGIAMFDLWIFVTYQGSLRMQEGLEQVTSRDDSQIPLSFYECKVWEAEQAKRIAEALDNRMKDVVYRDHPEFVRLHTMLSNWLSDLDSIRAQLNDDG